MWPKALKATKGSVPEILGDGRSACGGSCPRKEQANPQEKRSEGMPAAMSCRGCTGGTSPCRENPMSATRLKMAGRASEEQVAARLRKPVSGTVGNGVGSVLTTRSGNLRGTRPAPAGGTWTRFPESAEGEQNPRRGATGREILGGGWKTYREGGPNPMRGTSRESRPWTRTDEGIPEGSGAKRVPRPYRVRRTQYDRYFADW